MLPDAVLQSPSKFPAPPIDPSQTKKGIQWYFDMKAHVGVDTESGALNSQDTTAASVADIVETAALLHSDEETVFADAGYAGVACKSTKK